MRLLADRVEMRSAIAGGIESVITVRQLLQAGKYFENSFGFYFVGISGSNSSV